MGKKEQPVKRLFLTVYNGPILLGTFEVYECKTCGVIFTHRPGRLGQCPLGHDQ